MDRDPLELLLEDDFVFEPNSWDFAVDIGIRVDPEGDRAALEELADAMLVWMEDGPELERLRSEAMERLWSEGLEAAVREGVTALRAQDDWRAAAEAALAALGRDPRGAGLAVGRRLRRLAAFGRESLPALAPELQAIADEPLPARAAEDDVWEVVCGALLADVAAPSRN